MRTKGEVFRVSLRFLVIIGSRFNSKKFSLPAFTILPYPTFLFSDCIFHPAFIKQAWNFLDKSKRYFVHVFSCIDKNVEKEKEKRNRRYKFNSIQKVFETLALVLESTKEGKFITFQFSSVANSDARRNGTSGSLDWSNLTRPWDATTTSLDNISSSKQKLTMIFFFFFFCTNYVTDLSSRSMSIRCQRIGFHGGERKTWVVRSVG